MLWGQTAFAHLCPGAVVLGCSSHGTKEGGLEFVGLSPLRRQDCRELRAKEWPPHWLVSVWSPHPGVPRGQPSGQEVDT